MAGNLTDICEPTVEASTSHNPMDLHDLLQGSLYLLNYVAGFIPKAAVRNILDSVTPLS
jgi:hypothetical protein